MFLIAWFEDGYASAAGLPVIVARLMLHRHLYGSLQPLS